MSRLVSIATGTLAAMLLSHGAAIAEAIPTPYEQDFILTAYYSPLPDQCCYVKGGEEADKDLNGRGTHGADGTPVYPGMIAAPGSYPFGSRIDLPGIGVMTVHDRGGAIQELEQGHRIDVWAGEGEEGLARALAFGVRRVRGTVYPVGASQPPELFSLTSLPAPEEKLRPFLVAEGGLLSMRPQFGDHGLSVVLLQEALAKAGYFTHEVTGTFGDITRDGLAAFLSAMKLQEPTDRLTEKTAAYLAAAQIIRVEHAPVPLVQQGSAAKDVKDAQRLLRFLGFYRGRTDGVYGDALFQAILAYQKGRLLVGDDSMPGAGRIGPKTSAQLQLEWMQRRIAAKAERTLAYWRVRTILMKRGTLLSRFLSPGATGNAVRALQETLALEGFFPADSINGVYGPLTKASVLEYQIHRGIVAGAEDTGAGVIGPMTLRRLRTEQINALYRLVRAQGWEVL